MDHQGIIDILADAWSRIQDDGEEGDCSLLARISDAEQTLRDEAVELAPGDAVVGE